MRKLALEIISSFQKLISKTVTTCRVFKAVNLWCYPIRNYFESLLLNELVTFWYFTKMLFKHFHANKSLKQWPMSYPDDKDSPKLSSQLFVRLAKCRLYLHRRVSVITLDYEQIIWPLVIPRQAGTYISTCTMSNMSRCRRATSRSSRFYDVWIQWHLVERPTSSATCVCQMVEAKIVVCTCRKDRAYFILFS